MPNPGWEFVCTLDDLRQAKRSLHRLSSGRGIALFYRRDQVFAVDHGCYHHGGPLVDGDIEDLVPPSSSMPTADARSKRDPVSCVKCPWHKYLIALETGECFYVGLAIATKTESLKSKGIKQRVHPTRIVEVDVESSSQTGLHAGAQTRPRQLAVQVVDVTAIRDDADAASLALDANQLQLWRSQREATAAGAVTSDQYAGKPFNSDKFTACGGAASSGGPSYPRPGTGIAAGAGHDVPIHSSAIR